MERLTELKAHVYDLLAQKQAIDIEIQKANDEIIKIMQEQQKQQVK